MGEFETKLDVVLKHDDGKFIWFHPRVAAIPGAGRNGSPAVVMTLQKHLHVSDHYSGLSVMRSDDLGRTWTSPEARPELDWREGPDGTTLGVCDVTPGWHAPTGRLLAVGAQVLYNAGGEQVKEIPRASQTAYSVHDPEDGTWSQWRILEMPPEPAFEICRSACAQWIVESDGTLLLPLYHTRNAREPYSVTVARCGFDGTGSSCLEYGPDLSLPVERGLYEPSIARHEGRYYLTLRNDMKGYVTVSDDGLHYNPIKPWTFDDGTELGSYNTQQHWLVHEGGLFLSYTRRGADNDHIMRHRAPLFIARIDTERLHVVRETEQVLVPERGAQLGNFGAARITSSESWVTVAEGMWGEARQRGAEGCVFVARVISRR